MKNVDTIMKQYKEKYTNVRKGEDNIFTIFSRKYPMNNIQPYSLDGLYLMAGVYHCETVRQSNFLRKKLQLLGCKLHQDGDTEFSVIFRKELIEVVSKLIYIFPKKRTFNTLQNLTKTTGRQTVQD